MTADGCHRVGGLIAVDDIGEGARSCARINARRRVLTVPIVHERAPAAAATGRCDQHKQTAKPRDHYRTIPGTWGSSCVPAPRATAASRCGLGSSQALGSNMDSVLLPARWRERQQPIKHCSRAPASVVLPERAAARLDLVTARATGLGAVFTAQNAAEMPLVDDSCLSCANLHCALGLPDRLLNLTRTPLPATALLRGAAEVKSQAASAHMVVCVPGTRQSGPQALVWLYQVNVNGDSHTCIPDLRSAMREHPNHWTSTKADAQGALAHTMPAVEHVDLLFACAFPLPLPSFRPPPQSQPDFCRV